MVNYANAKIVSIGAQDHIPSESSVVVTTSKPSLFLGDLKRKYKRFVDDEGAYNPLYDIINTVGIDKITIKLLVDKPVANKKELNDLLAEVKQRFMTPIDKVIQETKTRQPVTVRQHIANLHVLMTLLHIDNTTVFFYNPNDVIQRIYNLTKSLETKKNYLKAVIIRHH